MGERGTRAHLLQGDAQRSMEGVICEIRTGTWQCGPHQLMQLLSLWTPWTDPTQGRSPVGRSLEKDGWTFPTPQLVWIQGKIKTPQCWPGCMR